MVELKEKIEYKPNRAERRGGKRGEPYKHGAAVIGAIATLEEDKVKKRGDMNRRSHSKQRTRLGQNWAMLQKTMAQAEQAQKLKEHADKSFIARFNKKINHVLSR